MMPVLRTESIALLFAGLLVSSIGNPVMAQEPGNVAVPSSEDSCPAGSGFSISGAKFGPGDAVSVNAQFDWVSLPVVAIEFSDQARARFVAVQEGRVGRKLPICLGDVLLSAPLLTAPIAGSGLQIAGGMTAQETAALAKSIRAQLVLNGKLRATPEAVNAAVTYPLTLDVAKAVKCQLAPDDLFTLLTLRDNDQSYARKRGWTPIQDVTSLYPNRYRLPHKISILGHDTDMLAFTGQIIFAVLADADIKALATQLSIKPEIDDDRVFTGGRIVDETTAVDGAGRSVSTMLQIITNLDVPARNETLIGCSCMIRDVK